MSNTTLHYDLREALPHLRDDGRLNVLVSYVLHANIRNRAWPSIETLMRETGWGRTAVIAAKDWLVEHGTLESVPLDKRIGEEARLHHRCDVMQLTGLLKVGDKIYSILYFNKPAEEDFNSSPSEPKNSREQGFNSSPDIRMHSEPEVVSVVVVDSFSSNPLAQEIEIQQQLQSTSFETSALDPRLDYLIAYHDLDIAPNLLAKWVDNYGLAIVVEVARWYVHGRKTGKVAGGGWMYSALKEDYGYPPPGFDRAKYMTPEELKVIEEAERRRYEEEITQRELEEEFEFASRNPATLAAMVYGIHGERADEPAYTIQTLADGANPHTVWETAYGQLQLQMPKEAFDTWLRGAKLLAHQEGLFTLGVPNVYAREWLEHRLKKVIVRALTQCAGQAADVEFVLWAEHRNGIKD